MRQPSSRGGAPWVAPDLRRGRFTTIESVRRMLAGIAVGLMLLLSVRVGVDAGADLGAVAPLLVVLGVALILAAAVLRFEVLALGMVAGRAALDVTHQGAGSLLRPSVVVTLAFTALALLWLSGRMAEGRMHLSPLAWALVALAVAATLSAAFADQRMSALEGTVRFVVLLVMVVTFEQLAEDRATQRRLYLASAAGALAPLVIGGWQVLRGAARIEGTFSHPNTYGFFLVITLLMGLAVAHRFRWPLRLLLYSGLGVAAVQLVMTFSRSSYIAFVAGLLAIAVASKRWWTIPLLAVVVAGTFSLPAVQERFSDLDADRSLRGTAGNSLVWRMDYWAQLAELAEDRPATGIGSTAIRDETDSGKPAHNDWVKAYVETGVVGTMAYAALTLLLPATAWRAIRRARDGWERAVALGFTGCTVAFLVSSLASNVIQQLVSLWYFFAFAALASVVAWGRDAPEAVSSAAVAGGDGRGT